MMDQRNGKEHVKSEPNGLYPSWRVALKKQSKRADRKKAKRSIRQIS